MTYYCDSGVFVAFFNNEQRRAPVVEQILEEAHAGKITIVTSSFALVEVIKLKGQKPLTEKHEQMVVDFFTYPFFKFVDANRTICEAARALIWKYPGLWPKDSVHLASAIAFADRENLDGLFSYDGDFTKLNGVITKAFPICEPFMAQPSLFSQVTANAQKETKS